ncbi:Chitinase [Acidisarcina polymorpha]|uniref:chitinase n=1 Tax=Acidisarcina polymorpha TaxID=2211140 RepID=A0A2Z5FVQ3_9BACT|nr:glycoside hydrolase family 18 protein [Acidisarcina polymorpha]AXC10969.1 Chitinase [Acidisarcina polymorpha]
MSLRLNRSSQWRLGAALGLLLMFLGIYPPVLSVASLRSHGILVGYFPQWGVYNQYFVKNLLSSGAASLLDQMDYSQGVIADGRCAIGDPNADLNFVYTAANSVNGKADDPSATLRGNFHQLQELRRIYPKLKVLISLEGKPDGFAAAARPENRAAFVSSCINMFVRGHIAPGVEAGRLFDGFDVDWEYPGPADKDNFLALLSEFRRQMDALHAGLKLSIAVAAGVDHYQGFDMKAISAEVDQVNAMNYDYNGPWSHTTGFIAPLYEAAGDPLHQNTVDATIRSYEAAGVPPAKLLLGMPFYAYGWSGVNNVNHGLFQPGQPIRGDHFYSYIQSIEPASKLYRESASQAPWLFDGQNFWTFDDPPSIRAKLGYARQHQLGGVMVWELSNDSADALLLKTIGTNLHARE